MTGIKSTPTAGTADKMQQTCEAAAGKGGRPVGGGGKGYKETGRDIYVENDMYYKVWDQADWPTRDAMDIAYPTGQRPADMLKMNEFDIQDSVLSIEQNKTAKKLQIAVVGELKKVLPRVLD